MALKTVTRSIKTVGCSYGYTEAFKIAHARLTCLCLKIVHGSALYSHNTEISTSTDVRELMVAIINSLYFSSLTDLGTVSIVSIASVSDMDAVN